METYVIDFENLNFDEINKGKQGVFLICLIDE